MVGGRHLPHRARRPAGGAPARAGLIGEAPLPSRPRRRLAPDRVFPAGRPGHDAVVVTLAHGERVRVVQCAAADVAGRERDASPPVVVCVHGWGCSAFSYNKNLRALADAGFDVLAPDLRGHGWSDKPLDRDLYTPEALGAWLAAVLDALGVSRAVLVGHSLGGAVVTRAARRLGPRVAGLVLLAPVGLVPIPRTRLLRALTPDWLERVLPYLAWRAVVGLGIRTGYGAIGRPSAADIDEYWAPTADPAFVRATRLVAHAFDWDPVDPVELRRLACPVHVIVGERDTLVPGAAVARVHGTPDAPLRIDVVPRAGHVLPEEVPAVVNAAVTADVRAWW